MIPHSAYIKPMNAWRQLGISGKWNRSIESAAGNASLKQCEVDCVSTRFDMNQEGVDDGICFTNQTSTFHQTRDLRLAIFFQSQSFALFFQTRFCLTCFPPLSWVCTRLFAMVFVQKVIWVVVSNVFFFDFHPSFLVKWSHLMFASFSKWMDIQPPTTVDHHLQRTKPMVNKCQ